ncbi:Uncharacterised protein [Escherichia coli]|nr:Uncharacterised protein [Escherichia coli]CTW97478.1 Uncharacterised protein [Escherichia coli]CTY57256.1 Uncharacterised protein [Escherichia coli]CUA54733.1 Uncharacterised protein [Escherichia coli]
MALHYQRGIFDTDTVCLNITIQYQAGIILLSVEVMFKAYIAVHITMIDIVILVIDRQYTLFSGVTVSDGSSGICCSNFFEGLVMTIQVEFSAVFSEKNTSIITLTQGVLCIELYCARATGDIDIVERFLCAKNDGPVPSFQIRILCLYDIKAPFTNFMQCII